MKSFYLNEIDINIVSAEEYEGPDVSENLDRLLYKDFVQENNFVIENIESPSF